MKPVSTAAPRLPSENINSDINQNNVMRPMRKFSFGQLKEMKDGKLFLTGKEDRNVIKINLTGDPKYPTSIRLRNGRIYMHSKGIQISEMSLDENLNLVLKIQVGKAFSMLDYNQLVNWISGINATLAKLNLPKDGKA